MLKEASDKNRTWEMAMAGYAFNPPTRSNTELTGISTASSHRDPHSNKFLVLFHTGSGKDQMTYFLVDQSGCRSHVIPKPYVKPVTKLAGITGYRVLDLNNHIYVTGGQHAETGSVLGQTYKFNPVNNQWLTLAHLTTARTRHSACVVGGTLYVCGGQTRSGGFTDSLECYDSLMDRWREARAMPEPRASHASCSCQGKLYVTGGLGVSTGPSQNFWQYDPATDFWTQASLKLLLPHRKEGHVMVEHRGTIFIIGGVTMRRRRKEGQFVYEDVPDPHVVSFTCTSGPGNTGVSGFWDRSHPDLPRPRHTPGHVLIGHNILLLGGRRAAGDADSEVKVEHYNIRRKRWADTFSLADGFSDCEACMLHVPTSNKTFGTLGLALSSRWIMW